jgi:hypothetical protein
VHPGMIGLWTAVRLCSSLKTRSRALEGQCRLRPLICRRPSTRQSADVMTGSRRKTGTQLRTQSGCRRNLRTGVQTPLPTGIFMVASVPRSPRAPVILQDRQHPAASTRDLDHVARFRLDCSVRHEIRTTQRSRRSLWPVRRVLTTGNWPSPNRPLVAQPRHTLTKSGHPLSREPLST